MGEYIVKIINIEKITHKVRRFVVERPEDYTFNPGQATEVAINLEGWKEERRPFTFTPFIAILRAQERKGQVTGNKLIFSNRTSRDIILREEFERMLGKQFINTLTEEDQPDYDHRRIDKSFLKDTISDFSQHFYVCGPPSFVADITDALKQLNAKQDSIVLEE